MEVALTLVAFVAIVLLVAGLSDRFELPPPMVLIAVGAGASGAAWGWAASTAVLVSLIFAMMTPWNDPDSKSQIGAARGKTGSSFRKHRHMMNAPKLLINLLYRASA